MKKGEEYSSEMSKVGFQTRPSSNSKKFALHKKSENSLPNMPFFLVVFPGDAASLFSTRRQNSCLNGHFGLINGIFYQHVSFRLSDRILLMFPIVTNSTRVPKTLYFGEAEEKSAGKKSLASGGVEQRKRKKTPVG